MPAVAEQLFRRISGDSHTRDIGYRVTGATDDVDALDTVEATAPATYDNMPLVNLRLDELRGPDIWEVTAQYSRRSYERPETSQLDYQFDFALGSQKIVQSRSTVARYPATIDFGQAINVDSEGKAQGTDIRVPQSSFSYTWYPATGTVTTAYQKLVQQTVGKVNSATWQGYAAGEVLFVGASGRARNNEDWEITYRFEYRANETGLTIGDITMIDVDGWDLLWVYYRPESNGNHYIEKPTQVNVERVYERVNFTTNLGF